MRPRMPVASWTRLPTSSLDEFLVALPGVLYGELSAPPGHRATETGQLSHPLEGRRIRIEKPIDRKSVAQKL